MTGSSLIANCVLFFSKLAYPCSCSHTARCQASRIWQRPFSRCWGHESNWPMKRVIPHPLRVQTWDPWCKNSPSAVPWLNQTSLQPSHMTGYWLIMFTLGQVEWVKFCVARPVRIVRPFFSWKETKWLVRCGRPRKICDLISYLDEVFIPILLWDVVHRTRLQTKVEL